MKAVTVREAYDWLQIGKQINQTEWDELLRFLQDKYFKSVEIGYGKIRFINLVGIIQLSTIRIEILPKLVIHEESEDKNREALINMLTVTRNLPVTLNEGTLSQLAKSDLFHVFAQVYIQSLLKELRRGIYREYKLIEENSQSLRGRFMFHQHIRKNAFQPVKAYCEYDEIQEDVLLNRILKRAVKMVYPYIAKSSLKSESLFMLEMFDQVNDVPIQKKDLRNFHFNRQNQRFQDAFLIARLILENQLMTSKYSGEQSFSFLFEMNVLFESYIERAFRFLEWENNLKVVPQHDEKRLLININSGQENIKLKPDFVIYNDSAQMIVDTKWKSILREGRVTYQQADLYQMYAYVTSYEQANRCVLLYPKSENGLLPKWQVPGRNKYIEIHTIRLSSLVETLEDLKSIIS
ncbi:McrC family protein [Mesobacillus jeotgali]|uniref:McrC family protein n=1 Tax=Mesobacillus jeotgali TaxID=129985 RepID=UPI001CFDCBE2|nr:McrC family protein [Mesobacillus jeotgali]